MSDTEKTQIYDDGPHHERAMSASGGRRRSTVTSVNMNKNLDAKYENACTFLGKSSLSCGTESPIHSVESPTMSLWRMSTPLLEKVAFLSTQGF